MKPNGKGRLLRRGYLTAVVALAVANSALGGESDPVFVAAFALTLPSSWVMGIVFDLTLLPGMTHFGASLETVARTMALLGPVLAGLLNVALFTRLWGCA
ncbi:MAG TPA: hypothetical protein VFY14_14190, partial [Streptomyces sp.]|nr:hypothetical protein [Streptomyces sp.]